MKNLNAVKSIAGALALTLSGSAFALQTEVASSTSHTLLLQNGSLYCTGSLTTGACLDGGALVTDEEFELISTTYPLRTKTIYSHYQPNYIGVDNVKTIDTAYGLSAYLTNTGDVYWMGYINGIQEFTPQLLNELSGATDISIRGGNFDGTSQVYAVIGGKAFVYSSATGLTSEVFGITGDVVAVDADKTHAMFLTNDGKLFAAGVNVSGQLGDGTYNTTVETEAVAVVDVNGIPLVGVSKFSAGDALSMATVNGAVYTWGINRNGALALGVYDETATRNHAGLISNYPGYAQNVSTNGATLIHDADGSIWAMGWSNHALAYRTNYPKQIIPSGVEELYPNNGDVWFVKHNGQLKAWGGGIYGQMGAGTSEELGVYSLETHRMTDVKSYIGSPTPTAACTTETVIEYMEVEVIVEVPVVETIEVVVEVEKIVYVEVEKIVYVEVEKIVYVEVEKAKDDNGHGNDADGVDESNPGNSTGTNSNKNKLNK